MRMRVSNPRSSFGMKCVQCGNELIAPERSEGALSATPPAILPVADTSF